LNDGTSSAPMFATLVSMTGHGDAIVQDGSLSVSVELRSVNHRHFKLIVRAAEMSPSLESRIESQLRAVIHRGCVSVAVKVNRIANEEQYRIHLPALRGYYHQLAAEFGEERVLASALGALLTLPGVLDESTLTGEIGEQEWPVVERCLQQALERLQAMRITEGQMMARDLSQNCQELQMELEQIAARAPLVVDSYRRRIQERVQRMLGEQDITLTAADVVREVAVYADRCDISEELVRLRSHIHQFLGATEAHGANGRKLDFLTQEMFREANTIGSKGNDVEIAQSVVELKNRIEKMREMVQNIE
jgi:uncharacterized protein (TIGR00255 family)